MQSLLFCLSATPVASFIRKSASYGLRSVFLAVADVFDTDSCVSIDFKLAAMVRKVASYESRSILRMSRYLCLMVVPARQFFFKAGNMVDKATSYGFRLRSSKHNSRANMYCVLIQKHVYTDTIESCQCWNISKLSLCVVMFEE